MEVVIVVALLALIGATVPLTLNFRKQIDKSNDVKRKKDLSTLKSAMDGFYNDHGAYPTGKEICFNTIDDTKYVDGLGLNKGCLCYICGKKVVVENPLDSMLSYVKEIPCDPNSTGITQAVDKDYIYNYDCDTPGRPQWYRIYAKLVAEDDPGIVESGCEYGCGPKYTTTGGSETLNENYTQISNNYAVTSANILPETGTISCSNAFSNLSCLNSSNNCMSCDGIADCDKKCPPNSARYIGIDCKSKCK